MLKRVITAVAAGAFALTGSAQAAEVKLSDDKTLSVSAEHGTIMWTDDAMGTPRAEVVWRDGAIVSRTGRAVYGRLGSDASGQVQRLFDGCEDNGTRCSVFSQ